MEFEWDDSKAETNYQKHGVRFSEAAGIWTDDFAVEIPDPDHSFYEDRWIRMGLSSRGRILIVVYVEKIESEKIRIISARKATHFETRSYYRGKS